MDHSPLFLNYKRNIQAIIKETFRLCALIPVGYIQGKILYCLVTSRSNHHGRIMSKNQHVYTALKSAVNGVAVVSQCCIGPILCSPHLTLLDV